MEPVCPLWSQLSRGNETWEPRSGKPGKRPSLGIPPLVRLSDAAYASELEGTLREPPLAMRIKEILALGPPRSATMLRH